MVKPAGANGHTSGGRLLAPFFLVHTAWAQAFLSPSARTVVANAPLVDHTRGCVVCNHVVLRRDVVEGRDFHVVAADKWASLRRDNGVDFEIRRFRRAAVSAEASSAGGVKSEKAVKGEASKKQKTATRPTRQATVLAPTALDLDLHPAEVELFYWDDAQQRAVPCVHDCGHDMRLRDPLGTFSCNTTCEEAQKKLASCEALDARTRGSLGERSQRSVDLLYWDFALHTWVLWRGSRGHKLPEDTSVLWSPKTGAPRLCVRKRLTPKEEAGHEETVKAAQARLRSRAKRADAAVEVEAAKCKQTGKAKAATPAKTRAKTAELTNKPPRKQAVAEIRTTRASQSTAKHSHSATVSKKALGKRRRLVRYDDDDEEDEDEQNDEEDEDEDYDDSDSEEECVTASAQHDTAAAVAVTMTATAQAATIATPADATDSQETVDTQPDADRAGTVGTLLADEKINAHVLLHALVKRLGAGGVAR